MKEKPLPDFPVLFIIVMVTQHFLLLAYFFALMLGMWAAVAAFQAYKIHQYPFLKAIGRYLIFLNSALFLYFLSTYLGLNFPESQFMEKNSVYFALIIFGSIVFWTGCVRSYIAVFMDLRKIPEKNSLWNFPNIILGVIGIILIIGLTTFFHTRSTGILHWLYISVIMLAAIVFFSGTFMMLRGKRSYQSFAYLSLVGYVLFFTAPLLAGPVRIYYISSALISLNLLPIIWLKYFFLRNYVRFSEENGLKFLDLVTKKYLISKREREVMDLILQGKSNSEIEKSLLISYNTVKNHIYNIYQKLGVKSRGQLIRFVLDRLKTD